MPGSNKPPRRQMDRAYWDAVAPHYGREIFSVRDNDTGGVIAALIRRHADPRGRAVDLGCGTGEFTPLLAQSFGCVHACDLSEPLLARARLACRDFAHVEFTRTDLASDRLKIAPADFALCVNVLIMGSLDVRLRALRTVAGQVRQGGHLVLVVPSLESMLYAQFRRIDWCLREGLSCQDAVADSVPRTGSVRNLHQGVRPIEGVPTKHYLREELQVLMQDHQLEILELSKLSYPWTTEFDNPPAWLRSPLPWNWLVVGRRL